jgi:S1-C subfamily serine protease
MKIPNNWKRTVEDATVKLCDKGGQGVVVPGGYLVTAAHCVPWDGNGRMALGDPCIVSVRTKSNAQFRVAVAACDPVTDIAVLGAMDDQRCPSEAEAFESWRETVTPIAISTMIPGVDESCQVHVLTHSGEWLIASVTQYGDPAGLPNGSIWIKPEAEIKGGTSGSPVVNDHGELVGIVSQSHMSGGSPVEESPMPVVHLAVPRWVLDQMLDSSGKRRRRLAKARALGRM